MVFVDISGGWEHYEHMIVFFLLVYSIFLFLYNNDSNIALRTAYFIPSQVMDIWVVSIFFFRNVNYTIEVI